MPDPYRVMTVCTGNICRSPIAEAVLRDRFEAAGLGERVVVDSAGTSAEELGNPIDPRAAAVLREAGYPVPAATARQVDREEVRERDLILAMTAYHARRVLAIAPDDESATRIALYRSFDPAAPAATGPRIPPGESPLDIDDPWYGGREEFVTTLEQVEAAADAIVAHVRGQLDAG